MKNGAECKCSSSSVGYARDYRSSKVHQIQKRILGYRFSIIAIICINANLTPIAYFRQLQHTIIG